jgi:DNA-binding NtrC family response regulator
VPASLASSASSSLPNAAAWRSTSSQEGGSDASDAAAATGPRKRPSIPTKPPAVDDAIRRRLLEADWPGNIRELAHYAERVALSLEETVRPADEGLSLPERLSRFEADLLRAALEAHRGDVPAVLAEMRVPRKTLYDKLQRHGLKPAAFRG